MSNMLMSVTSRCLQRLGIFGRLASGDRPTLARDDYPIVHGGLGYQPRICSPRELILPAGLESGVAVDVSPDFFGEVLDFCAWTHADVFRRSFLLGLHPRHQRVFGITALHDLLEISSSQPRYAFLKTPCQEVPELR